MPELARRYVSGMHIVRAQNRSQRSAHVRDVRDRGSASAGKGDQRVLLGVMTVVARSPQSGLVGAIAVFSSHWA